MSLTRAPSGIAMSRGGLVFRPATLDDAAFAADYKTALYPDDPEDPLLTRHAWTSEDPEWVVERYIVLWNERPIGMAIQRHAPWSKMPERFGRVDGDVLPDLREETRLSAIYDVVEERSRAEGTRTFVSWAPETDRLKLAFLGARGFREDRRERFWELDLAANRHRLIAMTEASRAKMRAAGVRIRTLAEESDPEKYRKLWRMSEEAEQDVPTTVPHVPAPFETFMKWMDSPGLSEDRIWIGRVGDDIVGVSMLSYPPVRGVVQTDWTATARSVRGRGVARALKCETVAQAIALGVDRVRTDNDGQNAPILHINETMGYVRRPDWIQFLKAA
jgi:hypothetical protein